MSDEHGGSGRGAIHSAFGLLFFIALLVWGLQIYLNKPAKRPAVACWLPYQVVRVASVEVPKIFAPRDHEIPLENARRAASFNRSCICMVSDFGILNAGVDGRGALKCE